MEATQFGALQQNLGLDIGCFQCSQEDPGYVDRPLTVADVNPYCVRCRKLYCDTHTSSDSIYHCVNCSS